MKKNLFLIQMLAVFSGAFFSATPVFSQDTEETTQVDSTVVEEPAGKDNRPERDAFESNYIINTQTVVMPKAKTIEFLIQHRFGKLNSGQFDMFGLYAPSNIRLGLAYTATDWLQIGIGSTKLNKLQDLNWKASLLKQTRSGSIPVSVSYFGDVALDVRKDVFPKFTNRLSYFHQLMVARRINSAISLQLSGTYSYFNILDSAEFPGMKHGNFGASLAGRYKFSPQSSLMLEYSMPFTASDKVKPNLGVGYEVATSGHAFQIFVSTFDAILGQQDYMFNKNDFTNKDILIGFNITRLWGF
jgi:hypothetical protein